MRVKVRTYNPCSDTILNHHLSSLYYFFQFHTYGCYVGWLMVVLIIFPVFIPECNICNGQPLYSSRCSDNLNICNEQLNNSVAWNLDPICSYCPT